VSDQDVSALWANSREVDEPLFVRPKTKGKTGIILDTDSSAAHCIAKVPRRCIQVLDRFSGGFSCIIPSLLCIPVLCDAEVFK
jgi:hypothetical protein